jgi:lysyl endopeptidase
MSMKKHLFLIFFCFIFIYSVDAQVFDRKLPAFSLLPKVALETQEILPRQDHWALLAGDDAADKFLPYKIGQDIKVNFNLSNSGQWIDLDNGGRIWTLSIVSDGALGLNLMYDYFDLAPGAQLNLYSKDKAIRIGSYTSINNKLSKKMTTQPIFGDTTILELYEPPAVVGLSKLSISTVIHFYKESFLTQSGRDKTTVHYQKSGSCNVDVACTEGDGWEAETKSVAMIQYFGSLCSGTLINNTANNKEQYFLTARHCIEERLYDLDHLMFYFNWEQGACGDVVSPEYNSLVGAELLFESDQTDVALLKITTSIPNYFDVAFAGWNRDDSVNTASTVIHHPSGDTKKISFDNDAPSSSASELLVNNPTAVVNWKVIWDLGTTEGGSSGSGLFNQNHHLIGQLLGGLASCTQMNDPDYFPKFSVSWDLGLKTFLDPLQLNLDSINTNKRVLHSADINLDGQFDDTDIYVMMDFIANSVSSDQNSGATMYNTLSVADIISVLHYFPSQ